jgi:predicted ATPase/class 3 adenylate cyclase
MERALAAVPWRWYGGWEWGMGRVALQSRDRSCRPTAGCVPPRGRMVGWVLPARGCAMGLGPAADGSSRDLCLLMVDVEGSTRLWQRDAVAATSMIVRFAGLVADVVGDHGGWLPPDQGEGDGRFAAFHDAAAAVAAALDVQRAVLSEPWPISGMRVRVGVHAGEVIERGGLLLGEPVHRCARVCGAGHGGQVLVSAAAAGRLGARLPAGVALRDLGEHRLRDIAEPERLYQLVHPDLPTGFPALRALHAWARQLPVPLDSFVGREPELRDLAKALAEHRLVTVTGPGGSGKTRLAVQVAREQADTSSSEQDGDQLIAFVDLAPLSDPGLLPERLAAGLGVRLQPDRPMAEAIGSALGGRGVLLVADNCEQLPTVGQMVGDLLVHAAGVRVLATSREPLRVPGEQEFPLRPLPVPDAAGDSEGAFVLQSPAVRLLADRAAATDPDFAVADSNAATVAAICRRLDGLPLAIELCAPWLRTLGPDALLAQLARPMQLLAQPGSARPDRHRTLRAAIDWSYRRLSGDEQTLLGSLAVFAGGGDLDAVTRVCAPDLRGPLLPALAGLVEKNLLDRVSADGSPRYRLLETIREYAAERLDERADLATVRELHSAHFAALAVDISRFSEGTDGVHWLERAKTEADNLRATMEHLTRTGQDSAALQVATDVSALWWDGGFVIEGYDRLRDALDRAPRNAEARPMGHIFAGWLGRGLGHRERAEADVRLGAALAHARGDVQVEAFAQQTLGLLPWDDPDRARVALERALELAEQGAGLPVRYAQAAPSAVGGGAAGSLTRQHIWRDLREARRWAEISLEWSVTEGYPPLIAYCRSRLGDVLLRSGEIDAAADLIIPAEVELRASGVYVYWHPSLAARADLALYRGDLEEAEQLTRECLSPTAQSGLEPNPADIARLVDILISQGRTDDAARALDDLGPPLAGTSRRRTERAVRRARLARLDGRPDDVPALLAEAVDDDELPPEQVIRYVESAYAAVHKGDTLAVTDLLDQLDRRIDDVGLVLPPQEQARVHDLRHRLATATATAEPTPPR